MSSAHLDRVAAVCDADDCQRPVIARGLCTMHYRRLKTRGQLPEKKRFLRRTAAGSYINEGGYRCLTGQYGHPLANQLHQVKEHRRVLYDKIGDGPHACHWNCGKTELKWGGNGRNSVTADHLNGIRLDNRPENLVPSCPSCNSSRRHRGNASEFSPGRPEKCGHGHLLDDSNTRVRVVTKSGKEPWTQYLCRTCERRWKQNTKRNQTRLVSPWRADGEVDA